MKHAFVMALAALLCGCYSSSSLEGDGGSDPLSDPPADGAGDTTPDPLPDPPHDPPHDPPLEPDIIPDPIHDPWPDPTEIPTETVDIGPDIPPDGPYTCPPRGEVGVNFVIDDEPWPMEEISLEMRCTIESVGEDDAGHTIITLVCFSSAGTDEIHTITIGTRPGAYMYIWEGEDVQFQYHVRSPWWVDRWFTLRYSWGQLALAGVDASGLVPRGEDLHRWYQPLYISRAEGLCPLTENDCGAVERLALDVILEGASSRIFDGNHGFVGFMESFQILVPTAHVYREMWCDDVPDQWFSALFIMIPEG